MVADYTPEKSREICHIHPEDLIQAARMYAKAEKAPIIYCLGVTEHSTGTEGVMVCLIWQCWLVKLENQAVVSILCEVKIMFKVLAIWAACLMISQAIKSQ